MADKTEPQTIVIDNFSGVTTRIQNGQLNSGLAQRSRSFGYNPFQQPKNLTWNFQPIDITASLDGLLLDGKTRIESGVQFLYGITNTGHFVKINTSSDVITDLHTLTTGTPTFNFGSSLEFFNSKIWITNDKGISRIDFDGTNETQVGTWDSSNFIQSTYHPLAEFQGKLYVGNTTNGTSTNIGEIDTTNLIINQNRLSPSLPIGTFIRDMDLTVDFSYLAMSVSTIPQENLAPGNDQVNSFTGDSGIFKWNGTDQGITAGLQIPGYGVTALNFFGETPYMFMYDTFGTSVYEGAKKMLTMIAVKSPLPNATRSSGNFITWVTNSSERQNFFFYGNLDEETPVGLYEVMFFIPGDESENMNASPFMINVLGQYNSMGATGSNTFIKGKYYFSQQTVNGSGTVKNYLYSFKIFSAAGASDTSLADNGTYYLTQVQLFTRKIAVKQIRVYCQATVTGNAFNLDLWGTDIEDNPIEEFSYTFAAGTNETLLQGALNRINFNPTVAPTYGIAIGLNNQGSVNMVIKKVEVDWAYAGD